VITSNRAEGDANGTAETVERAINWRRVLVYGVLPGLALILAMTAGFTKWQDSSARDSDFAAVESVQAAKDSTVALLSYKPDTVERDLTAARDRTIGAFRDSYTDLTEKVVIPGSKQKQIATTVTIPAATSVSADPNHAVVLVFVNQAVTMGKDNPTNSESSIRVTMDKVGDRWLVSGFDAV
jgi:Mce-associated membrane protein